MLAGGALASCAFSHSNPTRDLCVGLAQVWEHGHLDDVQFTAHKLGALFREEASGDGASYHVEKGPPELLDSRTFLVYQIVPRSGINASFTLEIDREAFCITPNQLQAAFGHLHSEPFADLGGNNRGLRLAPDLVQPHLEIFLEVGTGCLTTVEIYQFAEVSNQSKE